jgi:hypothetical protein
MIPHAPPLAAQARNICCEIAVFGQIKLFSITHAINNFVIKIGGHCNMWKKYIYLIYKIIYNAVIELYFTYYSNCWLFIGFSKTTTRRLSENSVRREGQPF